MAVTIDELQIEIQAKGAESASGIDKLTTSLGALKSMINKSLVGKLESLSSALNGIKAPITVNMNVKGMEQLQKSVQEATANMPANASNITPAVDSSIVTSEMGKIKASTEQAAGSFTTITSEATRAKQELKSAGDAASGAGKKLKEVGTSAKQGASGLSKFVSSLKRILMYRVVRSILSNIASAAKEGIQNLVQYGAAIGGIDASRANATMSQFASIGMQVKNTLGAALMPVLNALMPVIQTVANWFIIAANAVNQFFAALTGASTWSKATEGAVDYAGGLGKAAGAAKKLANATLGIDELNVISPNSGGGGGGGGGGAADFGNMFEEVEIDGKIKKFIDDIKMALKGLMPILKAVGIMWAGLWALKKLAALTKAFPKFSGAVSKAATALKGFMIGFAIGGIVSYIANIWAAKNGTEELGYAITGAIVVLGGLVTAIGATAGSIGILFAGIGLVIGAIVGLAVAQEQLLTEKVSEWFYSYSEGTVTITQLADAYGKMADEIVAQKQPIIDGFDAYEQGKKSVAKTSQELDALLQSVQYNTDSIKGKLPEIETAFKGLLSGTSETLAALKDNIILSLAGATGEAYTAMGGDLANIYALLDETFGAANDTVEANKQKISELTEQYNSGDISESAFISGLLEARSAISSLTQDSLPEVDNFRIAAQTAFDGINFENSDAVSEALGVFKEKTQAAKDAVLEAAGAEQSQLEDVKRLIQALDISLTPEQEQALADWQTSITTAMNIDTAAIDEQFRTATSTINTNLLSAMQGVAEQASLDWNNLNWLEKWWNGGSEAAYVAKAMTNYRTNIVTPINDKLIEANGSIGADVAAQTDSMMDDVMAALFTYSINGMGPYVSGFKTDIETAMAGPLAEIGKAMPQGVANGVNDNLSLLTDATKNAALEGIKSYATGQQSGSPAKKYIEQSLFAMQGLKKGIDDNKYLVTDSLKSLLNSMLQMMERFTSKIASALNDMLSNFASTMGSMSVGRSGSVNFSRMRASSIPRFAYGGYVDAGQLFIAREAGPEMVGTMGGRTAVANNDQIVEAVALGVYEAMTAAMSNDSQDGNTKIVINLDGQKIYENQQKIARGKGYNLGMGAFA